MWCLSVHPSCPPEQPQEASRLIRPAQLKPAEFHSAAEFHSDMCCSRSSIIIDKGRSLCQHAVALAGLPLDTTKFEVEHRVTGKVE